MIANLELAPGLFIVMTNMRIMISVRNDTRRMVGVFEDDRP